MSVLTAWVVRACLCRIPAGTHAVCTNGRYFRFGPPWGLVQAEQPPVVVGGRIGEALQQADQARARVLRGSGSVPRCGRVRQAKQRNAVYPTDSDPAAVGGDDDDR